MKEIACHFSLFIFRK